MYLRPVQPAVTAPSQTTIPGQVSHLLFNLIPIAAGFFPFLTGQSLARLPEVRLVIADVYSPSRSVLDALRL